MTIKELKGMPTNTAGSITAVIKGQASAWEVMGKEGEFKGSRFKVSDNPADQYDSAIKIIYKTKDFKENAVVIDKTYTMLCVVGEYKDDKHGGKMVKTLTCWGNVSESTGKVEQKAPESPKTTTKYDDVKNTPGKPETDWIGKEFREMVCKLINTCIMSNKASDMTLAKIEMTEYFNWGYNKILDLYDTLTPAAKQDKEAVTETGKQINDAEQSINDTNEVPF